ncbi:MAG: hypothetical protein AAF127_00745 [Pseudomonadota bacterium]
MRAMPLVIFQVVVAMLVLLLVATFTSLFDGFLHALSRMLTAIFIAIGAGVIAYNFAPPMGIDNGSVGLWAALGGFALTLLYFSRGDVLSGKEAFHAATASTKALERIEDDDLTAAWQTAATYANRRRVRDARRACARLLAAYEAREGADFDDYAHVLDIRQEVPKIAADMEAAGRIADHARRRTELRALEAELVGLGARIDALMDARTAAGLEERRGLRASLQRMRDGSSDPFA